MEGSFDSGGYKLACHLKEPSHRDPGSEVPGLILCHGFPMGPIDARRSAGTFPQFVDRRMTFPSLNPEVGCVVLTSKACPV